MAVVAVINAVNIVSVISVIAAIPVNYAIDIVPVICVYTVICTIAVIIGDISCSPVTSVARVNSVMGIIDRGINSVICIGCGMVPRIPSRRRNGV